MNHPTAFAEETIGGYIGRFRLAWRSEAFKVREHREGRVLYFTTAEEAELAAWRIKHKIEDRHNAQGWRNALGAPAGSGDALPAGQEAYPGRNAEAGMTIPAHIQSLCDEYEIRIVPKHRYPRLGETRAVASIRKMVDKRGMDHARIVLSTLTETANNKASLEAECIGAASDLLLACQHYQEEDPSKWFQVWDECPVGELQAVVHDLRGFVPLRAALAGLIYERIWRAYGPRSIQPDLLDDRMLNQ